MASIPSNLSRVPTLLASRLTYSSIMQSSQRMLRVQEQLATGRALNRPSDDVVGTSAVSVLDDRIERRDQRQSNLGQADSVLGSLDGSLADLTDLISEAKGLGLSQIGIGSDAATRKNQAKVIDALLDAAVGISNRDQRGIHYFGGSAHATEPLQGLNGGYRYIGEGEGMVTDIGLGSKVPITMSAEQAFGALSGRVEGFSDLNPSLTMATRLADLNGAGGTGVNLGAITVSVNSLPTTVDLSDAETVGDVVTRISAAIQAFDPGAIVSIDGTDPGRLAITPSAGFIVTIADGSTDATAADLGLVGTYPAATTTTSLDLNPRLTDLTPLGALPGLSTPLGLLRIRNANQVREVDLSGAATIRDLMNAFDGLGIGVRLEIAESGDRLNAKNELSGGYLSIEEIAGGTTATELGIRSLHTSTLLADFNQGRGVGQVNGKIDPISGLPDPSLNTDFQVTVKDGRSFAVDIDGATTVQDVLDVINAAAAAAGLTPAEFTAGLVADGNGIALNDSTVGTTTSVTDLNDSPSAEALGIIGSTTSASLDGTDRATVAVESVFSHLIQLRDALLANDERGISFATGRLDDDLSRAVEARADIGVRAQRVADATLREGDLSVQDQALRSQIQDLDYTEAALRFSSLQQILQAGYQTAAQMQDMSLLNFLR
ncbi:MAG: flagellin [Phycisphaerae bacterium]|nr:flagellin [Phycisphaerae bacterium]